MPIAAMRIWGATGLFSRVDLIRSSALSAVTVRAPQAQKAARSGPRRKYRNRGCDAPVLFSQTNPAVLSDGRKHRCQHEQHP